MGTRNLPAALLALALLPACQSDRLTFTTYTKFGLDLSATNGTTTGLMFGYKRFEGALIPVDMSKATGADKDLMPVFAAIDLTNSWFGGIKLVQMFATGTAAKKLANSPNAVGEATMAAKAIAEDAP
jgi:hypothetical protein